MSHMQRMLRQAYSVHRADGGDIGCWARPCTASRHYVLVRAYLDEDGKPVYDPRQHSEHDWRFITENITRREYEAIFGIRPADIVDRSR